MDITEELSRQLAEKFARQCFSGLELYSFKDNFRSLADVSDSDDGFLYWSEDTLIRFLGLPAALHFGPIVYQAATHLGAFPFPSLAPATLDFGALVKVVALLTGRYKAVLKRQPDHLKLLFRAFAVYDRHPQPHSNGGDDDVGYPEVRDATVVVYDSDDSEDLSLAALEVLDAVEVYKRIEHADIVHARIPVENMRKLIILLLALAPLEENQPLAEFAECFMPDSIAGLHHRAECVLRAFTTNSSNSCESGIPYSVFKKTIRNSIPFMFGQGLPALFSHVLFSKNVSGRSASSLPATPPARDPILLPHAVNSDSIMTLDLLSQLSLHIRGDRLWRRVRPLYAGSEAGFSMGSFETKVCKWNAPTILLVSGTRLPASPIGLRSRSFSNLLPPSRKSGSGDDDGRVVYGAFIETPWKLSRKECFGDANTLLFQLEPVHEVFRASIQSNEHAYFNKDDGIGFGSAPQGFRDSHRASPYFNVGPVSLILDKGLEFGVFTHVGEGGLFRGSGLRRDWQDRFEIEEIEVWGCGGESEAEAQRKAWQWEEREALLRRQINLGKDTEADRALLEMAGLVGQNRSGGSM